MGVVSNMVNVSRLMKCFFKGSNCSSLLQFSCYSEDQSDSGDGGDGGGIPVFAFLPISSHGMTIFTNKHLALIIYTDVHSTDLLIILLLFPVLLMDITWLNEVTF